MAMTAKHYSIVTEVLLAELIEQVNSRGWIAFHYPRLKKVAINGGRMQNYPEAIKLMKDMLNVL